MKYSFVNSIKSIVLLIFFISGAIIEKQSFAQPREALIKAGYIEKFTHFIQWPDLGTSNVSSDTFTIAVIGENTFDKALEELFRNVKINNKLVNIAYITSVDEIKNPMILFISRSEKNNLGKILNYTIGKPILTVSDSKGYGEKGVLINLFEEGNFIRYEVNQNTLEKSGLTINSLLLSYAVIIKSNG